MRNSVKACISKPSHRPLASRATVKACNCKPSQLFSLIFSRKRTFCERVNGKKREIYVYSIVPTKPSPSIHRAFFKHSPCFLQAFTGYGMGRRHHLALRIFHSAYRRNKSGLRRNKSGLRKNKSRTCAHNSWTCCRRFRRGEAETVKLR